MSVNSDITVRQRTLPAHRAAPGDARAPSIGDGETPESLYRRPGFLFRRMHQIASALFAAECGAHGVTTPLQYGTLVLLASESGLDQITLARRLGLDRSTAGLVVRNLAHRGLIERTIDCDDTRRKRLTLTAAGVRELDALMPRAHDAQERLLGPLSAAERSQLIDLLERMVRTFNVIAPDPIEPGAPPQE